MMPFTLRRIRLLPTLILICLFAILARAGEVVMQVRALPGPAFAAEEAAKPAADNDTVPPVPAAPKVTVPTTPPSPDKKETERPCQCREHDERLGDGPWFHS